MAARATMANLIALVRGLINDPAGATPQFSDDDIQAQLDSARDRIIGIDLIPYGLVPSSEWYTHFRHFEDGVVLKEGATVLTPLPETAEPLNGYWAFAESHSSVTLSGWAYDVYAAAAELLVLMSARVGSEITSFSADGSSFNFAGESSSLLKLAAEYRSRSPLYGAAQTVRMIRDDHEYLI